MTYRDSFLLWDERIELESYLPGYSDRYDLDQAFGDYYYYATNNSYYGELSGISDVTIFSLLIPNNSYKIRHIRKNCILSRSKVSL